MPKNELAETLGLPAEEDMFEIDGEKHAVSQGITLGEQDEWIKKLGGFVPKAIFSVISPDKNQRKIYYEVLARAFDNKVPDDKLKKMKAKAASDAIFRFLEG